MSDVDVDVDEFRVRAESLEALIRGAFGNAWWASTSIPGVTMPVEEMVHRARARIEHDHAEKCSVVSANLRRARENLAAWRAWANTLLKPRPLDGGEHDDDDTRGLLGAVITAANYVGVNWRDQEGVNAVHIDELEQRTRRLR